jgi:hypothetical protein
VKGLAALMLVAAPAFAAAASEAPTAMPTWAAPSGAPATATSGGAGTSAGTRETTTGGASSSSGVSLTSLAGLSSKDASSGLRTALGQGIDKAVAKLGVPNGFTSDPRFTIPLPAPLAKAEKVLRTLGMQKDADELKLSMNRAAELAVAEAKPVFRKALTSMTVADAKTILAGGETSATEYFRGATSAELATRFKPIVTRATEKVKLGAAYDKYAGRAAGLGLIRTEDANLNDYVTNKALDALYTAIADEERAIRKDPLGQTSSLLRKVFGGK